MLDGKGSDDGIKNCPLCKEFYRHSCENCPISKKTHRTECRGTPYWEWIEHHQEHHKQEYHKRKFPRKIQCSTCKELVEKVVEFAEDLCEELIA